MKYLILPTIAFLLSLIFNFSCSNQMVKDHSLDQVYPWCIVAFDSLERSPEERIQLLKDLGLSKYAYDWRDKHLDEMANELTLARKNDIEITSVWLWLNAKRDSLGNLSPANDRVFEIIKELKLETTLWVSFSNNFFEERTQEQNMSYAIEMIKYINSKAKEINCNVALYNHRGWFGNPYNQVEIIEALPNNSLSMVYNFHHAHEYLEEFPQIVKSIKPYLSAVNLNGMKKGGPKILTIGDGDLEYDMMKNLLDEGFDGPWGVLGHIENEDVKTVLERNIEGFKSLKGKYENH